ncbi:MAG TPA: ABC transporter substrate-binding protein [Geminicoccaceae bacterium]|nr:ABC transporter substrate-binding protein [Geminicoccaceae bacterium]
MIRWYLAAAAVAGALSLTGPAALARQPGAGEPATTVTFGYLSLADDPRYAALETYANIQLRPPIDPFAGAETALREGRILGRALKLRFELERVEGETADELLAGLDRLHAERGARLFMVDAPGGVVAELAERTRGRDLLLVNVSAPENALRQEGCAPHLLHTMPSLSMLTDALAQYAVFKRWGNILLLRGPLPGDTELAEAFARSAARFGAKVVDTRDFVPTNDPRQREQNNINLLTTGVDYDAAFVADTAGEFGRYLPYQTALPRPVIGSVGLSPEAWHWSFERHGAPQLNQRFERVAEGRRMTGYDWAAWAGVRVAIEAIARTKSAELDAIEGFLKGDELTFDAYKGAPASFRPWDNQLRQPVLLHTHDAVIARAPIEGFLHAVNDLDTLGADEPDSACDF